MARMDASARSSSQVDRYSRGKRALSRLAHCVWNSDMAFGLMDLRRGGGNG